MVWQHKSNGLALRKQRFGCTKVKVWHCETSTKVIRVGRYEHLRRSIRASASVGADVCVGRCGCLRRSVRMSASVDTSIRVGRYEHPRRSMRMTKVGSMKRKRGGVNEGKEEREAEERGVQAWGKRGANVGKEGGQTWGKRGAWVWQGCHTLLR